MTNTKRISTHDAEELVSGSAPSARPELGPLAALLEDYRTAATESHVTPSEELMLRLDFTHSPMVLQPQVAASEGSGGALRRAGSGLLGIGVAAAIVMGAASGAAALVGSAGMLPPDAQNAFNQLVSVFVPTEGAADGTADDEEAPGDTLPDTGETPTPTDTPTPEPTKDAAPPVIPAPPVTTPVTPDPTPEPTPSLRDDDDDEDEDSEDSDEKHENNGDRGNHGDGNNGANGNHGNGNNGNGNGNGKNESNDD